MHICLFIFYVVACSYLLTRSAVLRRSSLRQGIILGFFLLHVAAGCLHNWIAWRFFPNHGDIWLFFRESFITRQEIRTGFSTFWADNSRLADLPHNLIEWLHVIFDAFSFDNLYINTLLCSFLTMGGYLALFETIYRRLNKDMLSALVLLLLPSMLFWTSCIDTEGLIYPMLGWLIYHIDKLLQPRQPKNIPPETSASITVTPASTDNPASNTSTPAPYPGASASTGTLASYTDTPASAGNPASYTSTPAPYPGASASTDTPASYTDTPAPAGNPASYTSTPAPYPGASASTGTPASYPDTPASAGNPASYTSTPAPYPGASASTDTPASYTDTPASTGNPASNKSTPAPAGTPASYTAPAALNSLPAYPLPPSRPARIAVCILLTCLSIFLRPALGIGLLPAIGIWILASSRPRLLPPVLAAAITCLLILPLLFPAPFTPFFQYLSNRQAEFQALDGASRLYLPVLQPGIGSFWNTLPRALLNGFWQPLPGAIHQPIYLAFFAELALIWLIIAVGTWRIIRSKIHPVAKISSRLPTSSPSSQASHSSISSPTPASFPSISLRSLDAFCLVLAIPCILLIGYIIPFTGAIVRYRSIYLPFLLIPFLQQLNAFPPFARLNKWLNKKTAKL